MRKIELVEIAELGLPIGTVLDDGASQYQIEKFLGKGGFGITYLAVDKRLKRKVAIKEYFPSEFAGRTSTFAVAPASVNKLELYKWGMDRFLQEAQYSAAFDNPNLVRVLNFFEANGSAYMVMQYLDGEELSKRIARQSLTVDEAKELIRKISSGLSLLHKKGILHRDIKPNNIMMMADDIDPVLFDFGAARAVLDEQSKSISAIATPPYSPREQFVTSRKQTPATDIYAIGATVYRSIFGSGPKEALAREDDDNLEELDTALSEGRVEKPFAEFLRKCLEYKDADRFQSLDEMLAALPTTKPKLHEKSKPVSSTSNAVEGGRKDAKVSDEPLSEKRSRKPLVYAGGGVLLASVVLTAGVIFSDQMRHVVGWQSDQSSTSQRNTSLTSKPAPNSTLLAKSTRSTVSENVRQCDLMAGSRYFEAELAGIQSTLHDKIPGNAISVCRKALAEHPSSLRIMHQLARALSNNDQLEEAIEVYVRACNLGGAGSCKNAGVELRIKDNGLTDLPRAKILLERGCNMAEPKTSGSACNELGIMYNSGDVSGKKDTVNALSFYKKACDLKEASGCSNAGWKFENEDAFKSPTQARTYYERGCNINQGSGSAQSCNSLGVIYAKGLFSIGKNENKAIELYQQACDLGYPHGCSNAGWYLGKESAGTTKNHKAFELLSRGCDQIEGEGQGNSCYNLGKLYANGRVNGAKNLKKAVRYYKKSCELKYAWGCKTAGDKLWFSESVRDSKEADKFYQLGCSMKSGEASAEACFQLGHKLNSPDDTLLQKQAYQLMVEACTLDHGEACVVAGVMGLEQNRISGPSASEYYIKSLSLGSPRVLEILDQIDKDTIFNIQHWLKERGFYSGELDGKVGPATQIGITDAAAAAQKNR